MQQQGQSAYNFNAKSKEERKINFAMTGELAIGQNSNNNNIILKPNLTLNFDNAKPNPIGQLNKQNSFKKKEEGASYDRSQDQEKQLRLNNMNSDNDLDKQTKTLTKEINAIDKELGIRRNKGPQQQISDYQLNGINDENQDSKNKNILPPRIRNGKEVKDNEDQQQQQQYKLFVPDFENERKNNGIQVQKDSKQQQQQQIKQSLVIPDFINTNSEPVGKLSTNSQNPTLNKQINGKLTGFDQPNSKVNLQNENITGNNKPQQQQTSSQKQGQLKNQVQQDQSARENPKQKNTTEVSNKDDTDDILIEYKPNLLNKSKSNSKPRNQSQNKKEEQKINVHEEKIAVATGVIDAPQEQPVDEGELIECPEGCGRSFSSVALEKHIPICKKVFQVKRQEFNSQQKRLIDAEQAKITRQAKIKEKIEKKQQGRNNSEKHASKEKEQKDNKKWKESSEQFRKAIKEVKTDNQDSDTKPPLPKKN